MKIKKKYEDEVFKDVVGAEQHYIVSNYGRVFSKNYRRTGATKQLATSYLKDKRRKSNTYYVRAKMYHLNKNTPTAIHVVVAKAFVLNPDPKNFKQVNHKNGIKSDNRSINLEWCSNSENQKHAFALGLQKKKIGSNHPFCKTKESVVKKIKNLLLENVPPKTICKKLFVSKHIVYDIKRNKTWKHVE